MKTAKNLFPQIDAFENLYLAAQKAAKGKREQPNVMTFFMKLEDNLWQLQDELANGSYLPGNYRTFQIYDPKPRMISAAPFRDRVVHHALMNIAQPILERGFIFDTYANRTGKGTHKAIRRYQHFLRQYKFVLKCDIQKYFPTIDHEILKQLFRRCIFDKKTLWLMDTVVDNSNPQIEVFEHFSGDDLFTPLQRRRGLPIGNLTSQIFANFYLSPFDHFVKEVLQCSSFLRYVDDFALFSNSKAILWKWLERITLFLEHYRLKLNSNRCEVYPAETGRHFLGQIVFIATRKLPGANIRAFRKQLRRWRKNTPENIQQRIASWLGHVKQADTKGLLKVLLKAYHKVAFHGPLTQKRSKMQLKFALQVTSARSFSSPPQRHRRASEPDNSHWPLSQFLNLCCHPRQPHICQPAVHHPTIS